MLFTDFKNSIPKLQKVILGGVKEQFRLAPSYRKPYNLTKIKASNPTLASVLILFFPDEHNLTSFILTKRANYDGHHAKQISFPGGKKIPNDANLVETAIRETKEEIGIQIKSQAVFKKLTEVYIPPSNFLAYPFLAVLESNWSSTGSFEDYLINQKLVAIKGIDTRHLTHIIREKGNVTAQIVHEGQKDLDWNYDRINPVLEVTTKEIYQLGNGSMHIAVMDYGIKKSILNQLLLKDFKISVCPATTSAEEVLQLNPDGIFLSNGPGDPSELTSMINEVKIMSDQKPTFGICLGHQLLAHAYGCKTRKLKFGHRGPNHPVKDITLDRVFITSQNHGYMIDESSLNKEVLTVTHLNVNDETIEGMKHNSKPIFSVQYHPEAAPGPDDSNYLFDTFEKMVKEALC